MGTGTRTIVQELPKCQFDATIIDDAHEQKTTARHCPKHARYDFKTERGPWAYGCEMHYFIYRAFKELGTGRGQQLELYQQDTHEYTEWPRCSECGVTLTDSTSYWAAMCEDCVFDKNEGEDSDEDSGDE